MISALAAEAGDTYLAALAPVEVDTYLAVVVAEADIRLAVAAAEVDTCLIAWAAVAAEVNIRLTALVAAIVLDTAVSADNPHWAAAIVQMVVRAVVTATAAFAMETDLADTVALVMDTVT